MRPLLGVWAAVFFFFLCCAPCQVRAADQVQDQPDLSVMEQIDFSEVEDFLSDNQATENIRFRDLIELLLSQDAQMDKTELFEMIWQMAASELTACRGIFLQLLIMCAAFALLHNFAGVFENSQIHTVCFYMFYLALITLLMQAYLQGREVLSEALDQLNQFMQALIPAFSMALFLSSAASTATVFYQIAVAVIFLIENILMYVAVPAVHVYVVLQMLNHLTGENMISRLTQLLRKGICWLLRILTASVAGISIIQSLIAPALDGLKNSAAMRALNLIPGFGSSAGAAAGMFLGSAVVVKNGIGVAALLILLILCLGPVLKMVVITILYKLTGALVQPVSDQRVCGCISDVGDSVWLLLQILVTAAMMFMVTIAVVTAAVR